MRVASLSMNGLHEFLTPLDWSVAFACLLFTSLVGYCLRGRQADTDDFFLGGRSLPWPAVTGSLIAAEIGAATFLVVPGSVMALRGDFTYLQWAIGSLLARVAVGCWFVKVFYEKDTYSPYDFIGRRLGEGGKRLATALFLAGSVLPQCVRLLVATLVLRAITPLPFEGCLVGIGVIAVGWTLIGGMRTVIWTDVVQLGLFVVGGLTALWWLVEGFSDGWETLFSVARSSESFDGATTDKMRLWNFDLSPELRFTFWVAVFAVPFLHLHAFGVDQRNVQRLFCCRDAGDARKAVIWSWLGQLATVLLLLVGAALHVFYTRQPPTDPLIMNALRWSGGEPLLPEMAFPVWIVTELPAAARGLLLAGILAAAISSLDSILAALSQTTLSWMRRSDREDVNPERKKPLRLARLLVLGWGVVLIGSTFGLFVITENTRTPVLPSASGLLHYTAGPLLGIFLVALFGKGRGGVQGLLVGTFLSFLLVLFVRTDLWDLFPDDSLAAWLAQLPGYERVGGKPDSVNPTVATAWMWPVTTVLTAGLGWISGRKKPK